MDVHSSPTTSPSSLTSHLQSILPQDGTRNELIHSVLPALLQSIADIAEALRSSHHVSAAGTANSFGDDQLNVDVTAENLIRTAISRCPSITTASSEEDPVERPVHHAVPTSPAHGPSEQYTLAFDPLDGSSIIPANWTVGTIFSLWDGGSALHSDPHTSQIAAILGVYGPRTTAILALRTPSSQQGTCLELALDPRTSTWTITRPIITLAPTTEYFAPANLRAAYYNRTYQLLIDQYIKEQRTLRYSGGLVPDVVHMLVQGQGVYLSPVTEQTPAKLRRLYELCPLALVVECAGGQAVDPVNGRATLSGEIRGCDEKGGIICGGEEAVEEAVMKLVDLTPGGSTDTYE